MSPDEIKEVQEIAGDVPGEYLIVPQHGGSNRTSVARRPDALNLEQLEAQLFGINNQISDDQLLVHWKNGLPAARLIELLPGNSEDMIQCLFASTRLDQPQPEPYDALCCAWIPDEADVDETSAVVYIGQQYREVRRATAEALKALRSPNEIKKVWVEELCIVQDDDAGFKAFQQRSTSLIYNCAERTIIWAGPGNDHSEAAWTLIEILSHRCNDENRRLPSPSDLEHDAVLMAVDLLPVGSESWQSLLDFFPPHLFSQGWLLHDVAFAKKAIVKFSIYELEWWQVARVRDMLSQPSWMNLTWR
jgi:hypothetical protein